MQQQNTAGRPAARPAEFELVCPLYEIVHNYARQVRRPLTNLEQRAFLYLLDVDPKRRFVHADDADGTCICMKIMPEVIAALEGDEPVDATIARRSLEDETYQSQRFHTEKVGRFQGIVLAPRTEKEKTQDLEKLVGHKLHELELVLAELVRRPPTNGFRSAREAITAGLPGLLDLVQYTTRRRHRRRS